jgi:hypothetical protein
MDWYERYKPSLMEAYGEAERTIGRFPSPLKEAGLAYAESFHPVKVETGKDYICTLLPFWLREASGISGERCGQLALANVYGMLYFFMLDDVMDGAPSGGNKERLALANLFYLEMFAVFRALFPSDSPFWSYYERYVAVWADSVVNESGDNYFVRDPLRMAGKAAPVKVACAAAWLLAGRPERIAASEEAVDIALMTLQMLDDWADWETDMAEGNYNGLVAMIAARADEDGTRAPLTSEQVRAAIYVKECLTPYSRIALHHHERLLRLPHAMPELVDFHAYMVQCLTETAKEIAANKRLLLGGGINLLAKRP